MEKIEGLEVQNHKDSSRILNIQLDDDIVKKLIFPFNKFDIIALEYKPFTRFTLAKSLDDITENDRKIDGEVEEKIRMELDSFATNFS